MFLTLKKINYTCALLCAGTFSAFIISCENVNNQDDGLYSPDKLVEYDVPEVNDTLVGELLVDTLGYFPDGVGLCDSLLVVADNRNPNAYFTVYNTKTNKIICQFGTKGHAKNEFIPIISEFILYKNSKDEILMQVPQIERSQCVKIVNLTKTLAEDVCVIESVEKQEIMLETQSGFNDYYILGDNSHIYHQGPSYVDYRDNEYLPPRTVVLSGKDKREISCFPKPVNLCNKDLMHTLYGNHLKITPDRTRIVETMAYIGIITVFDMATNKTLGIKDCTSYSFHDVESSKDQEGFPFLYYNRRSYVTNFHIFELQDMRLTIKGIINNARLLVFDFEGNLKCAVRLAEKLECLAYDESSYTLYGVFKPTRFDEQQEPYGKLYKYDLSKYLK